ncbi:MAG: hypothetical protein ABIQ04_04170 [Candidatus Saccharimonadales bacterium]
MPRPAERGAIERPEPTRRQPEGLQSFSETPEVPQRPSAPRHSPKKEKSVKRFLLPIIIGLVLVIIGITGWFLWSNNTQSTSTAIDSSKYQAVFFTNGQVYFGKLQSFNSDYLKLTDIYYLQTQTATGADSKNPQQTSTDQSNVQLIKLGDEIHGPEDQMIIAKSQLLFYENLKTDGKVAQSIDKYKKP